jgi:hypothetical protein
MFRLLIDTCVFLDLAKDAQQQSLLTVLEELIERKEVSLIIPETVVNEFNNNKDRVLKENSQSLSSVFKRVSDVIHKFGDPKKKEAALEQLRDVDYKIPIVGGAASMTIDRIDKLLKSFAMIPASESVKLKAADRAIQKKAPFHRNKNSFNDAIIIETFFESINDKNSVGSRFAFITHNKLDFSDTNKNDRHPHPDIAQYFSRIKSLYFIKLAEALHRVRPELVSDIMMEEEFHFETRSFKEILEAEEELEAKIWYNRHQIRTERIESGEIKIIDRKDFSVNSAQNTIVKDIWEGAKKSARKIEKKYGKENLQWDDFDWGMLNGKLSALRWVMGDDWDSLYT